eukprot:TRINITY_DN3414_c0_g1_i2.p1 TRINITY_DN3414_c0_g1~~TRINITY_DN3414_c0_g1_i2.p1  ORF type:complete len:549 (+),score=68.54 TRINITY_DN3414_c0_g1_i2:56-1702(+)
MAFGIRCSTTQMVKITAVIVATVCKACVDATDILINTPLGKILGDDNGEFRVWRGIRYAEPPARFEVSVPKKPWAGIVDATKFGSPCILDTKVHGQFGSSEDCLFANVWTPSNIIAPLPVVVFIHGGGFMTGSGADPRLWGDLFVTDPETPVVYVTMNYRMGILGFYSGETGANFGFQDQQLALRFVRDNIAAFGGDAKDITLAGQSAGAVSVQVHLVAPGSQGLFHRAFLASTVGLHYRSLKQNQRFVDSAARSVGCFDIFRNFTQCMKTKNALELDAAAVFSGYLFNLQSACDECDNILPWLPVVDGDIIPRDPLDMLRDGSHAKVPVVVSTVRNESWAFLPGILHGITDMKHGYNLAMHVLFRDNWLDIENHYANSPDSAGMNDTSKLGLAVSDALFTCYSRYVAKILAQSSPSFLSTFMHAPSAHADPGNAVVDPSCEKGVTCHSADLNWMFPNSPSMSKKTKTVYTNEEQILASKYSAAVRAFAYENYFPWLPYSADVDDSLLWGDVDAKPTSNYDQVHCDMFERLGFPAHAWNLTRSDTFVI